MHFFEILRYAYADEDSIRREVGDMISFLFWCPELCRNPKLLIKVHMSCLYLRHVALNTPEVKLWSASKAGDEFDLSELIRPFQSYLLSSDPECNIFTDKTFVTWWNKLPKNVAGTAFKPAYSPWSSLVDVSDKNHNLKEPVKC